jgi:hypothetical protein
LKLSIQHLAGAGTGFDSEKFFKLRLEQYRGYRTSSERALDALRGSDVDCGLPFFRRLVTCGVFHGFLLERTRLQVSEHMHPVAVWLIICHFVLEHLL